MKVIAVERGFYGGKIQEPLDVGGEPFSLTSEKHLGKWMEPQGWTPSGHSDPKAGPGASGHGDPVPAFTEKHNGGGRWVVVDTSGEKVGDFVAVGDGAKEAAHAEADRLNAGGEPYVKPSETAGGQGGEEDDPTLPDA